MEVTSTAFIVLFALMIPFAAAESWVQCPATNREMIFIALRMDWMSAEKECQYHGGHLATLRTPMDGACARRAIQARKVCDMKTCGRFWVGLNNLNGGATWRWTAAYNTQENDTQGMGVWSPGEPNNPQYQHCGTWDARFGASDDVCGFPERFICERRYPIGSDIISIECDGKRWEYHPVSFTSAHATNTCQSRGASLALLKKTCIHQLLTQPELEEAREIVTLASCALDLDPSVQCAILPQADYDLLPFEEQRNVPRPFLCMGKLSDDEKPSLVTFPAIATTAPTVRPSPDATAAAAGMASDWPSTVPYPEIQPAVIDLTTPSIAPDSGSASTSFSDPSSSSRPPFTPSSDDNSPSPADPANITPPHGSGGFGSSSGVSKSVGNQAVVGIGSFVGGMLAILLLVFTVYVRQRSCYKARKEAIRREKARQQNEPYTRSTDTASADSASTPTSVSTRCSSCGSLSGGGQNSSQRRSISSQRSSSQSSSSDDSSLDHRISTSEGSGSRDLAMSFPPQSRPKSNIVQPSPCASPKRPTMLKTSPNTSATLQTLNESGEHSRQHRDSGEAYMVSPVQCLPFQCFRRTNSSPPKVHYSSKVIAYSPSPAYSHQSPKPQQSSCPVKPKPHPVPHHYQEPLSRNPAYGYLDNSPAHSVVQFDQ